MKIAVLIQCHKNPEQINRMLCAMRHPAITFFIHEDKKSSIGARILESDDIVILPDKYRVDVQWSKISQVDATLNLLKVARSTDEYDFFWVCSGQDFPIKTPAYIVRWFEDHRDNDFLELFPSLNSGLSQENHYDKRNAIFFPKWMLGRKLWQRMTKRLYTELTGGYNKTLPFVRRKPVNDLRFYFGSSWVCLSKRTWDWMAEYLQIHPEYYTFFKNCNCPDESFFQTLVMNSPYADNRMDYLHFVEWPKGMNNPKVLTIDDYKKLVNSDKLMARKFDDTIDENIIKRLESR